jgi:hypothetical protein
MWPTLIICLTKSWAGGTGQVFIVKDFCVTEIQYIKYTVHDYSIVY